MRKCASGGQSLANAERGVGMSGFAGTIGDLYAPVPPLSATPASRGNSCLKSQHDALRPRNDDTLMRGWATGLEEKRGD